MGVSEINENAYHLGAVRRRLVQAGFLAAVVSTGLSTAPAFAEPPAAGVENALNQEKRSIQELPKPVRDQLAGAVAEATTKVNAAEGKPAGSQEDNVAKEALGKLRAADIQASAQWVKNEVEKWLPAYKTGLQSMLNQGEWLSRHAADSDPEYQKKDPDGRRTWDRLKADWVIVKDNLYKKAAGHIADELTNKIADSERVIAGLPQDAGRALAAKVSTARAAVDAAILARGQVSLFDQKYPPAVDAVRDLVYAVQAAEGLQDVQGLKARLEAVRSRVSTLPGDKASAVNVKVGEADSAVGAAEGEKSPAAFPGKLGTAKEAVTAAEKALQDGLQSVLDGLNTTVAGLPAEAKEAVKALGTKAASEVSGSGETVGKPGFAGKYDTAKGAVDAYNAAVAPYQQAAERAADVQGLKARLEAVRSRVSTLPGDKASAVNVKVGEADSAVGAAEGEKSPAAFPGKLGTAKEAVTAAEKALQDGLQSVLDGLNRTIALGLPDDAEAALKELRATATDAVTKSGKTVGKDGFAGKYDVAKTAVDAYKTGKDRQNDVSELVKLLRQRDLLFETLVPEKRPDGSAVAKALATANTKVADAKNGVAKDNFAALKSDARKALEALSQELRKAALTATQGA